MNSAQRRGPSFERQVADWLKVHGFPFADRRVRTGVKDKGDITGIFNWVLELKAPGKGRPLNLSQALKEAELEAQNDGVSNYAAIVKRTRTNVKDSYAVIPLWRLARSILIESRVSVLVNCLIARGMSRYEAELIAYPEEETDASS